MVIFTQYNVLLTPEPRVFDPRQESSGIEATACDLNTDKTIQDVWAYGLGLCAETVHGGGKRLFDLLLSLLLLMFTGPVICIAMALIWLAGMGREPVVYRQTRVGLKGKQITLLKLRTMRVDAERGGPSMACKNDPRITRLGRILRRSRIDELPQLINVLHGDMSMIGPRPERPEFVAQYERQIEGYHLRHLVKPGITGLAQVRFGYAESLEDTVVKFYHDIEYLKSCGLWTDLKILLQSLPIVFTGWGAR